MPISQSLGTVPSKECLLDKSHFLGRTLLKTTFKTQLSPNVQANKAGREEDKEQHQQTSVEEDTEIGSSAQKDDEDESTGRERQPSKEEENEVAAKIT